MSTMRVHLEQYLTLRRAMGFQLHDVARQLDKFVSHLDEHGLSHITTAVVASWISQLPISPTTKADRFCMIRHFAQHVRAADPQHEVPPAKLFPRQSRRQRPYIYSDDEITRLMHAAQQIPWGAGACAKSFTTLLGLLVVTGMRIGECLALNDPDVDLEEGILTIVGTKFRKSRLIPLHPSTQEQLKQYKRWRNHQFSKPRSPSFLVSSRGTRLWKGNVRITFHRLSRHIGIRRPGARHGPRLHDFRHTFAVNTLRAWYDAGVDVEQHLPQLATYLGHAHVADTYWYLTGTPELLRVVAARVDRLDKEAST
jgi:integrase